MARVILAPFIESISGKVGIASTDPRKVRQKYLKTPLKPRFSPKKNEANQYLWKVCGDEYDAQHGA